MSAHSNSQVYPVRAEIEKTIADLIAGRITRENAALWADTVRIDGEHREITDFAAWGILKDLCGAAAETLDRPCLYVESDFYRWLNELRDNPAP